MPFWNKVKSLNETLLVAIVAMIIVPFGLWFYNHNLSKQQSVGFEFRCPSEYETSEEYLDDLGQWISKNMDMNPEMTEDELFELRKNELENHKCSPSPWLTEDIATTENVDSVEDAEIDKFKEAIKYAESQEPPRIGKDPTVEDVYNSPYIKHIRFALNGYLDSTNNGIEEHALVDDFGEDGCGLNKFSKTYYKSKFLVFNAEDGDYGGVQAYIVFVDKPDTLFWVWVYRLGGDGEYVLRAFCADGPPEEKRLEFKVHIEEIIKNSKYFL